MSRLGKERTPCTLNGFSRVGSFHRDRSQKDWREQRQAENARRRDAGEQLLSDEPKADHPLFAPVPGADVPNRLEAILLNRQIGAYCDQINDVALEALDKLKLAGHVRNTTN